VRASHWRNGRRQAGFGQRILEDGHSGIRVSGKGDVVTMTRGRSGDVSDCTSDCTELIIGLKVAGPTGRFKRALLKKVNQSGGAGVLEDEDVGRVLRQCLWQWAYELNAHEYQHAMESE